MYKETNENDIHFDLTCSACPLQYDIILKWEIKNYIVWYVRLRYWYLSAEFYPEYLQENEDNSIEIYNYSFDSNMKWTFESMEEKNYHLWLIKQYILWYIN
jgi:hypothetical protein